MDSNFLLTLIVLSAMFFAVFIYMKISKQKDRTILNTFPFENNHKKISNNVQNIFSCASTICSIIFLITFVRFKSINSWLLSSLVLGIVACIAFLFLCFVDFYHLAIRILINVVFMVTSFLMDVTLSYGIFKIGSDAIYYILGIIVICFAILRTLPFVFAKIDLKNEIKDETEEIKRPAFVQLAFFEWAFKILSFFELIILYIITV